MRCSNAMDDLRWHAPHAIPRTIRYRYNVTGYGLIANGAMCARGLQNRETRAQTERRRGKPYASTKNRKQLCGIYSHLTLNAGDGPGIKEATDHSNGSRLLIII